MRLRRAHLAVLGLVLLAAIVWMLGPADVARAIAQVGPLRIALAALAIAAATAIGVVNSYRICALDGVIGLAAYARVFVRSWAVGLVVPGQVADVAATLWQLRGAGTRLAHLAGRLTVDKLLSLTTTVAWAVAFAGFGGWVPAGAAGAASLLLVLAAWPLLRIAAATLPVLLRRWRWSAELQEGIAATPARLVATNLALSIVKLQLIGVSYWLLLAAFPLDVGVFEASSASAAAGLVAYVPISFNGIGTVELSGLYLFGRIGCPAVAVVSVYLVLRLINLALAWLATTLFPPVPRDVSAS